MPDGFGVLVPEGSQRSRAAQPGRTRSTVARPGSKHHLIAEAHRIPLAVSLTGSRRNDVTQLMPLIQAIPPVRGRRGRPRRRPDAIYGDRGYDHRKYRTQVRKAGITRRSLGAAPGMALAWACTAGSLNSPSPCCTGSAGGDPRRRPRSLPQPGLQHHLLASAHEPLIVLEPLTAPPTSPLLTTE